jgi:hypothetical protein
MLCAKHCKSLGLDVKILEKAPVLGGVWLYNEKVPGGVMASTQTTSSWSFTEISDFPLLPEDGLNTDFPRHDLVLNYLQRYGIKNGLDKITNFNTEILRVQKISGLFQTLASDGRTYRSKRIVMATGSLGNPRSKGFENLTKDFTGEIRHANTYKRITEELYGKRVLVVGGGETASDLCNEVSYAAEMVYLSIPNGQWFGGRFNQHWDYATAWPLDNFSSRLRRTLLDGNPDPEKFEAMKVWAERYDGASGHGYECWKSPFETYGQAIINKSNDVLRRCVLGRVTPKGKMKSMSGRSVYFEDGSAIHDIDLIYFATGYAMYFPMLKDLHREHQCASTLYKFCMDTIDESIGFVGFCRPIRGSFPSLSETCGRLLAHMWSGKIPTPPPHERERVCRLDRLGRDMFFTGFDKFGYTLKCPSSGGVYRANYRAAGLVDLFYFNDACAKLCGIMPNYTRVLLECGVYKWAISLLAPYHQCQFMLNDPSKRDYIFSRYDYFLSRFPVLIPIIFSLFQGIFQEWKAYLRNRFWWTIGYLFMRKPHAGAIHVYDFKAAFRRAQCALSVPDALKGEWPPADGMPRCQQSNEFCKNLTKIALGDMAAGECGAGSCGAGSCDAGVCGKCDAKPGVCKCAGSCDTGSCGTSSCDTGSCAPKSAPASSATTYTTFATKLCGGCGQKMPECRCGLNTNNNNTGPVKQSSICFACGLWRTHCTCPSECPPAAETPRKGKPTNSAKSSPSARSASPAPARTGSKASRRK